MPQPTIESDPDSIMMIAVVQAQDVENATSGLTQLGITVTRLPSVGGFLGRKNVTLMIGMPKSKEAAAMNSLQKNCRQRVEYIAVPLESAPLPLPAPTPITVGGATVFTLDVEHYEDF